MTGFSRKTVISALGILEIFNFGSTYYLPAVLSGRIAEETGWPLAGVVAGLTVGLLAAGFVAPFIGSLIAHHGGRPVLASGSALLALGLAAIGAAPNLPLFLAGWAIIGLGTAAGFYDATFATLARLYGATARSAITAVTLWGGLASTFLWPLSSYLLGEIGWRGTCFAYAAIHIGVMLPVVLVCVPRAAPLAAKAPDDAPARAFLVGEERRQFWLFGLIATVIGIISAVIAVHILTLLQERGFSLAAAVALGTLIGPAQVAGRIVEMVGGARYHPVWTMFGAIGLVAAGLVLFAAQAPGVAVALVIYAAGNGIFSIARGTLPLALFGPERYARVLGRIALPTQIAQAIAPTLAAAMLAREGTGLVLAALAILAVVNAAAALVLFASVRR